MGVVWVCCVQLSNTSAYPNVVRAVADDATRAAALVRLLTHFDYNYVGVLYTNDTFGASGVEQLLALGAAAGVDFEVAPPFLSTAPLPEVQRVLSSLKTKRTAVNVIIAQPSPGANVLRAAAALGMYGEGTRITSLLLVPALLTA